MSETLHARLVYKLHDETCVTEGPDAGPARFCPRCIKAVDSIMPVIRDWIWNGSDNDDLD